MTDEAHQAQRRPLIAVSPSSTAPRACPSLLKTLLFVSCLVPLIASLLDAALCGNWISRVLMGPLQGYSFCVGVWPAPRVHLTCLNALSASLYSAVYTHTFPSLPSFLSPIPCCVPVLAIPTPQLPLPSSFSPLSSSLSPLTTLQLPLPLSHSLQPDQLVYVSSSSTILLGQADSDNASNAYDVVYGPNYYNASQVSTTSSSLHYDSVKIRSIYFDGQIKEAQEISCFVEEGEEDHDSDGEASSHYEAIYEAISEQQHHQNELQNNVSPVENDYHTTTEAVNEEDEDGSKEDYDDSFDSDYSDEAYSRLHPQCLEEGQYSSNGLERQESQGSSDLQFQRAIPEYHRQSSLGSASSGTQSITKFAEAANLGMRKLRRNWSQTKTEVKTGLNKIKKKGNSPSIDGRSIENIYSDASPISEEKPKWSLKNFGRRKSTSSLITPTQPISLVPAEKDKETATFYLTLTIETDKRDAALAAAAAEASQRLKGMDLKNMELLRGVDGTDLRSVLELGRIANVGVVERPKSCIGVGVPEEICSSTVARARQKNGQRRSSHPRPMRPKNAPPAPPSDYSESEESRSPDSADCSKDRIAMRLNQILLAGPTTQRGRKILRSSVGSSSESSPVPVLVPPESSPTSPVPTAFKQLTLSNPSPSSSRGATLPSASKYSLKASKSCDELNVDDSNGRLAEEVTAYIGRNLLKTRSTAANSSSYSSNESCARPSLSSVPPPLPARPTGQQRLRKSTQGDPSSPSTPTFPVQTTIPEHFTEVEHRSGIDCNGDSSLLQPTEEPTYISSHFADEPLYQFYTASVLERATYRQGECSSEDDYEVINDGSGVGVAAAVVPRPTAMEIVTPADGRRTLWCELPEVASSGILNTLTSGQRKVQEAMFEVITSEASYLKSLEVLVSHFLYCPHFSSEAILSKREKNILFSDILPVKRCSEAFLADLEKRWQESALISTIADVVLKHASSTFGVYVKYCSNQIYQDRMLKQLKESNSRFMETLTELESSPKCQSLAMHSFLMLPMQRITRLPLLLDAIFHRLEHGSPHWHECNLALATLNKIVTECNEGARKMERMEEMLIISRQLDFREVRAVPLISASRWLVKKGELTRLTWRDIDTKLTFGKRISKHSLYFFLFTDLLVVTKRKSEDSYTVLDHCLRNMVQVLELDNSDKPPGRWLEGHKNLLIVTMLQNHENKTVEMVLSCSLESERTRWVEAVTPRTSDNPDEQIYEEWDCPQVQAAHPYSGSQPDELSLEVSDVVNVLKKMADGWYQGERLRDGERGWFPGSYCKEIASAHVRARNLRQRYRLLAISGSMVEEIRRSADASNEKEGATGKTEKEEKKERRKTVTMKDVIYSQTIK
ncbi:Dbl (DH) domain [Trinorchestia longiramus]|nr:Dbl (DH) domain [Trinorchestia longiramus]